MKQFILFITFFCTIYSYAQNVFNPNDVNVVKINDFSNTEDNTNWIISKWNRSASTTKIGADKKLLDKAKTNSDYFTLSCDITPCGETFEVLVGKYASTAGTMIGLQKTRSGSFINVYRVLNDSTITLGTTLHLKNVSFVSGNTYKIQIKKITDKSSYFKIVIIDRQKYDVFEHVGGAKDDCESEGAGANVGCGWGQIAFWMNEGKSYTIRNISFGFPVKDELKMIILGHSYIEGNSISENKDKRFSSIICSNLDSTEYVVLGEGGQKASQLVPISLTYANWFKNTKYALICIGCNDGVITKENDKRAYAIKTLKSNILAIQNNLQSSGIIPIWMSINLTTHSLEKNWEDNIPMNSDEAKPIRDDIEELNNWLETNVKKVIYINDYFTTDGEIDENKFLPDGVHPSIQTHEAIAKFILYQLWYVFNSECGGIV